MHSQKHSQKSLRRSKSVKVIRRHPPPQKQKRVSRKPSPTSWSPEPQVVYSMENVLALAQTLLGHSPSVARRVEVGDTTTLAAKDGRKVPVVVVTTNKGRHDSLVRGMLPIPPRLRIKTRFQKTINLNNAGLMSANVRFEPTFCFDVDPVLGSTAMPFFAEVMGLYRFYRTIRSKITVQYCNLEGGFSILGCVCPVNFDPTANTLLYQNYLSNPNSKSKLIGIATGEDTGTIHHHATTAGFAGSRWLGDADYYSALGTGTAPQNNWYWYVGISTSNAAGFGNGAQIAITMEVEFVAFEETSPSS